MLTHGPWYVDLGEKFPLRCDRAAIGRGMIRAWSEIPFASPGVGPTGTWDMPAGEEYGIG